MLRIIFASVFILIILFFVVMGVKQILFTSPSLNFLDSKYLVFHSQDGLKFFYEPKPDTIETLSPTYVKALGYPEGTKISYQINSDGLNQIKNISSSKKLNEYRIVTLGNSFTFGSNVNTNENYPSRLEKLLNDACSNNSNFKFEILNLGVPGYDFQYDVERYRLKGKKYSPDLVLWLMLNHDFLTIQELQTPLVARVQKEILADHENIKQDFKYKKFSDVQLTVVKNLGGEDKVLKLQLDNIVALRKYYSGKLIIDIFDNIKPKYKDLLANLTRSNRDVFISSSLSSSIPILKDRHPTPVGHAIIARNIFSYLIKNNLVPCDNKSPNLEVENQ